MTFPYAAKCKILLVEDSITLLDRLHQLLTSEGYSVQKATSRKEAQELFDAERFHVAVIDARLDNDDPYNHDGLRLMRELRVIDPSTAVILLTVLADLDIVREAIYSVASEIHPVFEISPTAASDYLEKKPHELHWLPSRVQKVLEEVVRINWGLQIVDFEQFMVLIPRRMRFDNSPDIPELQAELEELLRKLFAEWIRIDIETIADQNQGYSKSFVFQVTPRSADGAEPMVIAKVGEQSIIEQEVLRYRDYVERLPRIHRIPAAIAPVRRTRSLGGMIYTFHGLGGNVRDFAQFYRATKDHAVISSVIENLFTDTLALQHGAGRVTHHRADLRPVYADLLRLNGDELHAKFNHLLGIARAVNKSTLSVKFWLDNSASLTDPLEYAMSGDFTASYVEATIHGELHTHNVLVDQCNDTWLIDFANTGKGPLLQDYIAFEASLLIDTNECPPGRLLAEWSKIMFEQPGELFPQMSTHLAAVPELAKVYHSIITVRRLALRERVHPHAIRTYLIGLFFTCLRMMTVKFLIEPKRFQALTLAALIADNLSKLEQ